jgi:hypothetical protein
MTKKISAKPVDRVMYSNYLKKAIENYEGAVQTLKNSAYNAAAVSAVHSAISAADAYCVSSLGLRCTSARHEDAADLIMEIPGNKNEKTLISKKFKMIVSIKNMAEYEERLVKPKEAEKAVAEAGELLRLIKSELKEK